MPKQTQFLRAFYEIATSIGGTLDLEIMCRAALNAYHRKLSCSTSSLVCASKNGHYIYISAGESIGAHKLLIEDIDQIKMASLGHMVLQKTDDQFIHCVFELPQFGALILTHEKNDAGLEYLNYEQDLVILNHNFAAAAIACLQNQDLKLAEAEAQKALKTKSNFLANVSHELRTPMNAIMGFAGLLQRKMPEERQKEFCSRILESSQMLMNLVNDMLDFNNIDKKAMHTRYPIFNLQHEIWRLLEPLQKFAQVKGLNFIVTFAEETNIDISTDVKRLIQVIAKLVDNAVKFSSCGDSVHIQCSTKKIDLENHEQLLVFKVIDTGPGIPKPLRENIFEPFQQDYANPYQKHQGAGLGLALCKKIVSHMGGEIFLKNTSIGCHIEFTWPCTQMKEHVIKDHNGPRSKPSRFLIVDDNDINRDTLIGMLSEYNAEITIATNGLEAIYACQQHEFDLIFMDYHMPIMNGVDAAKVIRNLNQKYRHVPIFAVSAEISISITED